ncbi:MAG: ATP-binding cassette domain-containing protein [Marinilabiliales bacterium]|nr:ATP-binding cassette domain-containing protein [Marinilabiliales bacterium]
MSRPSVSSVEVEQGEIVGLLGPNGAGKTTTFYMMVGLIRPNGGKIWLDNTEITSFPMYRRSRMGIGYLAQEASVFRKLSVEDNLMAVMELSDMKKEERKERLEIAARGVRPHTHTEEPGHTALGRRTTPYGDSPGPGTETQIHPP